MNPKTDIELMLGLAPEEAEEILNLCEAILRDNTPDGAQFLRGQELVNKVLHYNDPENFQERNRQRHEMVEEVLQMNGAPARCAGTYQEAEIEYEYLFRISSIYLKVHRAGG